MTNIVYQGCGFTGAAGKLDRITGRHLKNEHYNKF